MPREELTDDDYGGGDLGPVGSADNCYDAETNAELDKMLKRPTGRTKPAQPQK